MRRPLLFLVLSAALSLAACENKSRDAKGGEGAQDASKEAPAGDEIKPSGPVLTDPIEWETTKPKADANLLSLVSAAADNCELERGQPKVCEGEQGKRAIKGLASAGVEALPTLAVMASSRDMRLREMAGWFAQEKFDEGAFQAALEGNAELDEEAVERLLEVVRRADQATATRLVRVTTHAAMAADRSDALLDVLAKHSKKTVRLQGYRASMRYGRLRPFEVLKGFAEDEGADRLLRQAAFRAPLEMERWTEEEADEICSWMADHVGERDAMLEEWPARALARCGGDHVSLLIAQVEERVEANDFGPPFSDGLGELCTPRSIAAPEEEQCEEFFHLLEAAIEREALADKGRANALHLLAKVRPDERSLDLIESILKEKDTPEALRAVAELNATTLRAELKKKQ